MVTDHLEAFWFTEPINSWLGWPPSVPRPERYLKMQKLRITNHDSTFNVLFGDGSVKSYSDGAKNVWHAFVDHMMVNSGGNWGAGAHADLYHTGVGPAQYAPALDQKIWKPYLDTAYAAD